MRQALAAVAAFMMLSVAARADGPIRGETPGARGTGTALKLAARKRFALQMPLMNVGRKQATATLLKTRPNAGKILILGGAGPVVDQGSRELEPVWASTELYDPLTNTFAAGPNMRGARYEHTATMIVAVRNAGNILVAGGYDDNRDALASTELYDPVSSTFRAGPTMSIVRVGDTATAIASGPNAGKILIAGGYGGVGDYVYGRLDSTELYDPVSNTFARGPSMHHSRVDHTATVIASGASAGKILIAGGDGYSIVGGKYYSGPLASTELYDPAANTFLPGPPMSAARESATATVIVSGPNTGKILITGGFGEGRRPLSTTELYDPATNRFAPGPLMNAARGEHTATTIVSGPNAGKLLLAGGEGDDNYLASTELYDPGRNAFAVGPTMNVARHLATATAVASGPNAGMILLAGGAGYAGVFASAEVYDPAADKFAPPPNTPEMEVERLPAGAFQ